MVTTLSGKLHQHLFHVCWPIIVLVFNHDLEVLPPYSNNYACTYIHSLACPLELTRLSFVSFSTHSCTWEVQHWITVMIWDFLHITNILHTSWNLAFLHIADTYPILWLSFFFYLFVRLLFFFAANEKNIHAQTKKDQFWYRLLNICLHLHLCSLGTV